jgi:hypothetical protein
MCKPASDTSNATFLECHSTRAHAMIIWRVSNDIKEYTDKEIELLFKTNLDSVSEAFCVDHYPVSEYMLAARQDIIEAGRAPETVKAVLTREQRIESVLRGETAILSCEAADFAYDAAFERTTSIAEKLGVGVIQGNSGASSYFLGDEKKAKELAEGLVAAIVLSKVKTILTDGPETQYALTRLYARLGVHLPDDLCIRTLSSFAAEKRSPDTSVSLAGVKVFYHDSRASWWMAESKPDEKVIMPDFFGPEELLGSGAIYEEPRKVLKALGVEPVFSVWTRAMARSMGMDEGLLLTYPQLAEKLARRRLAEIKRSGSNCIFTDSLATIVFLSIIGSDELKVIWLPEIF